jgi:hypothetical protein
MRFHVPKDTRLPCRLHACASDVARRRVQSPLRVRIRKASREMVEAIAEKNGISISDVVRMGIRRWHGEQSRGMPAKSKR